MEVAPPDSHTKKNLIVWLGLACIFAAFFTAVVRLHPKNFFGYTQDDSIYFSSAKGLAEGKGYVLTSVPGSPAATKYPILYPWLLSWVWRWNPSFPSNLADAIAINFLFGVAFLAISFLLLRRFRSLRDVEALLLIAFCAMHPLVIFFSGSLHSEIPFAALALASLLVADDAMRPAARPLLAIISGVLVGLSMMVRVFAIPVAAGIVVAALYRGTRRQLVSFIAALTPFFGVLCWRVIWPALPQSPVSGPLASSVAWIHTWAYYTSYVNVWRQGVPTLAIFLAVVKNNAFLLLSTPGMYFLYPLLTGEGAIQRLAVIIATVASLVGLWRDARRSEFRPVHFAVPFYALLVLVWNYPQADRFLLPFLPIFAAGIWIEAKHALGLAVSALFVRGNSTPTLVEKLFATVMTVILVGFITAIALNFVGVRGLWSNVTKNRAATLQEKLEAYSWIARSTPADTRVVAYEDASLYLYTGRQAIRPFTFTTADFFDSSRLETDLDHLDDVAAAIGARYWVTSDDDYSFEWPEAYTKIQERMRATVDKRPMVFRSIGGHVRVYLLGCPQQPGPDACAPVPFSH
jgi:hypothetical protein